MTKKTPHFFQVRSRIGLTHPPVRQTEWNFGVEEGSMAIVTGDFLSQLKTPKTSEFTFTNPEDIDPKEYIEVLVKESVGLKDLINQNLKNDEMQIVVGGDNTVTFSSFLALLERVGNTNKVGYIQFDSHGEINSFNGSDSKNFHGMYMRPFFDQFDIPELDTLVPKKLDVSQMFVIGDQILDGDEPEFYLKNNLHSLKYEEYCADKEKYQYELKEFLNKYDYIHVNFDIDVFHRSVAGATGIPEDGEWRKAEIFELLDLIKVHPNISFDLSEINPKKTGADQTIKIAHEVLSVIIQG